MLDMQTARVGSGRGPRNHEVRHAAVTLAVVNDEVRGGLSGGREERSDRGGGASLGRMDHNVPDEAGQAGAGVAAGPAERAGLQVADELRREGGRTHSGYAVETRRNAGIAVATPPVLAANAPFVAPAPLNAFTMYWWTAAVGVR